MKKSVIYIIISLVIGNYSLLIAEGETWKELYDSTNAYMQKQDFQTALQWGEKALVQAEKEFGKLDTNYINSSENLYICYYSVGNMKRAIDLVGIIEPISLQLFGDKNKKYYELIANLAVFYDMNRDVENAGINYDKSLEIGRILFSEDKSQVLDVISYAASFYHKTANFTKAESLYLEALELTKKYYYNDFEKISTCINSVAVFYKDIADYSKAEKLFSEALEIRRKIYTGDHTMLAESINNMGFFYHITGKFDKAESLYLEVLEMQRRLYKNDNFTIATTLNNLGGLYFNMSKYKNAEKLFIEALEMRRRLFKTDHLDLARSLNNLAAFYLTIGNYKNTEKLYLESLEMRKRIEKIDGPDLARSLNNIGQFYYTIGDYKNAESFYLKALKIYKNIYKTEQPDLIATTTNLASFYLDMGCYDKAEPLYKGAYNMSKVIYKEDHPLLSLSINNLGYFYNSIGDYQKTEELYQEALEMRRRLFKSDHIEIASSLNNLAENYRSQGKLSKSESLFVEALEMRRRIFKSDHPDLAGSINSMAMFYHSRGDYAKAESLYIEALEMRRRIFKSDRPNLASSINNMAYFYHSRGDYAKAEPLYEEALDVYRNILNNYFPSLSEKEKKQFWSKVKNNFESFNSFASQRGIENPETLSKMYDNHLFTKALLFNATSIVKSRILNSNDSILIAQYRTWSDKKEFLVKLYSMTEDEVKKKGFDIDSIENIANDLEKELTLKSEDFKQAYEKKKITWRSIQTILQPDEAAVEVIRFRKRGKIPNEHNPEVMIDGFTDTVCYAFLIVSENTEEYPELVILENGKELENEYYNDYRGMVKSKLDDDKSFARYWEKLHEKLKGYKKIYFSADGIYNKLNPSTLLMPEGKYLLDVYDIQQLNSTKDILLGFYETKQESNIYNSAVLIGNPNFALSEEEVRKASERIRSESTESEIWEPIASTRGIQLTKLPGTEKEIQDVSKFLESRKWDVKSYVGDMALKTAVKAANSPRVLHIATHGMFLEDVKRENSQMFGFDQQRMVDNPLLRSGLFFTGADNYLKADDEKPTGDENGVLTAYEAMNLDLDKTELVVLSACETGLGEIKNGEGVFGLRRAFQTAGAKTVVMSLWTVNDQTTQELMSSFYSNWVSGMAKRDAFSKAQQLIKEKYKAPYFWGAFLMVGE